MALSGVPTKKQHNSASVKSSVVDVVTNEKLQNYQDFIAEFKEILDKDRDEITEIALELEVDVPKNAADRDKLSAIFVKMVQNMLEIDA